MRTNGLKHRGFVLISSILILIVLTLLALSMFRSFGLQERISGNVREKQRALHAAITAEQFAEWWLAQPQSNPGTGVTCATLVNANAGQTQTCANALATPTAVPWIANGTPIGVSYMPPQTSPTTPFTLSAGGGDGTYYAEPRFYIQYLGQAAGGLGNLYQIDAFGFGGSPSAVAVVESTFVVSSSVRNLGEQ